MDVYVLMTVDGPDVAVLRVCRTKQQVLRAVERAAREWAADAEELDGALRLALGNLIGQDWDVRWESGVGSWDFDVQSRPFV